MSGSGGGGQTSSTTVNTPDPVTQAWRQDVFNRGTKQLDQGPPAYYSGQTVAPLSSQTQSGLQSQIDVANGGVPNLDAAKGANARALSGWNPAYGAAANAAYGGSDTAGQVGNVLQPFASATNPYLDQEFQQGAQDVTNGVLAQFSQGGRFGANASLGAGLSKGLGSLYTGIYAPAYESNMNRGLQAAGMYSDALTGDANRRLSGASTLGSMYSQGNADAATATGQLGSLYSASLAPGLTQQAVGSIYDSQNQANLDADKAKYDYTAQAPWAQLQQFSAMMSGLPQFTTSSTNGTTQQKQNSGLLGILGTGAQIGSLFL